MVKQIIGAAIGLLYAIVYGFFSMLITGGGHANFLWMMAFIFTFFFGLFFPIAGGLVADIDNRAARISLVGLLCLNHLATIWFFFLGGLTDDGYADMIRSWNHFREIFIVATFLHLLPIVALWTIVIVKSRGTRVERSLR